MQPTTVSTLDLSVYCVWNPLLFLSKVFGPSIGQYPNLLLLTTLALTFACDKRGRERDRERDIDREKTEIERKTVRQICEIKK